MNFIPDIYNSMLSEFILILTILILSLFSMFYNVKYHKLSKWIAIVGITISLICLKFYQLEPIFYGFNEAIISDIFTVFIKALILISAFIIVLLSKKNVTRRNSTQYYYQVCSLHYMSFVQTIF